MARILICYLVQNSGHHSAARAIEQALHRQDPSITTMCVDLLAYTHPRWSALIQRMYMVTIRRTPELWDTLYDSPWVDYMTRRVRALIQRGNSKGLLQLMDDFKPDAAICTQAHPMAVLKAYMDRRSCRMPLWGVVTDLIPHRFWVAGGGGIKYVVPSEEAAERLVWLGVQRKDIRVLGIPINPGFVAEMKTPVVKDEHLRVLVMGGSRGLGARYRTIKYLDQCKEDFTIDVVTGSNRRLRARLARQRNSFRHPIRIRGFVKDVVALMHRASLLITKPGGLTSAEAMATGLPMVLIRPLPGQEKGNTEILVRHGMAVHLRKDREVAPVVSTLLRNKELLEMMSERARFMGKPEAAMSVAAHVIEELKNLTTPRVPAP